MTEAEWLNATDPTPMLEFLRWQGGSTGGSRKPRLFAAACCRQVWPLLPDERSRRAVEVGEQYADGLCTNEVRRAASVEAHNAKDLFRSNPPWAAAWTSDRSPYPAAEMAIRFAGLPVARQADILRELYGCHLFRPVIINPAWLAWSNRTVPKLAQTTYDERHLPTGHLDPARLAIMADALEEAGCVDPEILGHCRGPGPHVRGCWIVDLLLGKE